MDIVDFRLFCHVSETRSMTHGADRSHLSLAAASVRIKNIEQALGTRLLLRTNQGVALTAAGQLFLQYCHSVLLQLDQLQIALEGSAHGMRGRIRICTTSTAFREFLPSLLRRFLARFPHVDIDLIDNQGDQIISAVVGGRADIGIYPSHIRATGLATLPYRSDHFSLVVYPDHPLAPKASVVFAETLDYDYVITRVKNSIHHILLDTASRTGKPLRIRTYAPDFESMYALIEAGIGIGITPAYLPKRHATQLPALPLKDAWAVRHWNVCARNFDVLPEFTRALIRMMAEDTQPAVAAAS